MFWLHSLLLYWQPGKRAKTPMLRIFTATTQATTLDKKRNHPRDSRWEERCSIIWYHAQSRTISPGPKSRGESQMTLPCADHLWSSMIRLNSTSVLLTANQGDGSFFLFRVLEREDTANKSSDNVSLYMPVSMQDSAAGRPGDSEQHPCDGVQADDRIDVDWVQENGTS